MQVSAEGAARVADLADPLARGDRGALVHGQGSVAQVHEDEVAAVVGADDEVVAGAGGLVGAPVDDAGPRGDERRPLGRHDVLALVDVAGAAGAEAGVGPAEGVGTLHGEGAARSGRRRRGVARGADGAGAAGATTRSATRPGARAERRRRRPASSTACSRAT